MILLERLEALAAGSGLAFLRALPPRQAARLAGRIASVIGPLLPVSRVTETNLRLCLPESGNRTADIAALTSTVNACLERWIRARPESWLWLHRRFTREEYRRGASRPQR